MTNIWDTLFPSWARGARQREIFQIENRASVRWDKERKDYVLIHHPSRDNRTEQEIPFAELRTRHSKNDFGKKLYSFVVVVALLCAPPAVLFHQWAIRLFNDDRSNFIVLLFLAGFVLLAAAVIAVGVLLISFQRMEQKWQNSIQKFFDPDTKTKMLGIKDCLLTFRRFIKWRRSMAYLLTPSWFVFWAEVAVLLWSPIAAIKTQDDFSRPAIFAAFVYAIMAFLTLSIFAIIRRFRTDNRDPTLQLCVMVAEDLRSALRPIPVG